MNQTIAAQNAAFAAQQADTAAQVEGMKATQQLSGEQARMAAAGMTAGGGTSAGDVLAGQRGLGAFSQAQTMAQGQQRTYGYETQEAGFSAERKMWRNRIPGDILGTTFQVAGDIAGAAPDMPSGTGGTGLGDLNARVTPSLVSGDASTGGDSAWMQDPSMWGTSGGTEGWGEAGFVGG
jgi:hypothetical protein